jgi:hypothetical protein
MAFVSTFIALATGAMVSSRLAQIAAIAAGAFAGICIASFRCTEPDNRQWACLVAAFSMLVGGAAWIACIEPDPPQMLLLGFPLLPAALWCIQPAYWRSRPESAASDSLRSSS